MFARLVSSRISAIKAQASVSIRVWTARDDGCGGECQNWLVVLIENRPLDADRTLRLGPRWRELDHLALDAQNVTGANWSQPAQFVDGEAQHRVRPERTKGYEKPHRRRSSVPARGGEWTQGQQNSWLSERLGKYPHRKSYKTRVLLRPVNLLCNPD